MFINFWYAAAWSRDVGDTPVKVRMLGQDFVVFRDAAGNAKVLSNVCVHRGGSLAQGKVMGDCVQCPYHGWQFDGQGVCQKVPSMGNDAAIPSRARVDAYPTEERYGLIFAFLGDLPAEERPPIMEIPEYGAEGWRTTELDYRWSANYERSIENGLDPAHNEFVHPTHGFEGANPDYFVPELYPDEQEWGFSFMTQFKSPAAKGDGAMKLREGAGTTEAGTGHVGPCQMWTFIHFTETNWIHQYIFETPVEEDETQIYLVNLRNAMLDPAVDARMSARNFEVAEQDRVVIEALNPPLTPPSSTKEVIVPADKVIMRYRERLMDWQQRGWRIDTGGMNGRRNLAYAIPSPGRREHRRWALDTVPLVSST